ncbi:hypothetical protein EAG_03221 [Camponotus floridanus]|uniref:Uncharacterized protein n=1 Tax=Camponotus floridanus TaxID=104421 RepID=E2A672_CAMFO|nr:hypothetical protein EAG_03221 [Camponotus floridanus]
MAARATYYSTSYSSASPPPPPPPPPRLSPFLRRYSSTLSESSPRDTVRRGNRQAVMPSDIMVVDSIVTVSRTAGGGGGSCWMLV